MVAEFVAEEGEVVAGEPGEFAVGAAAVAFRDGTHVEVVC